MIVYAVAILALLRAAFDRSISASECALGIGLACCAILLSFPLLAREYAMRLSLMAFAPAALAAVFVLAPVVRRPRAWPVGVACAFGIAAVAITPVVRGISGSSDGGTPRGPDALLKGPVIPNGSDAELIAMRSLIANPAKTLVVARHGLQWWAGHLLHTPVRNTVPDDAFTKYERVLRLVEVGRGGGPGGRMGPDGFDGMDGPPRPPGFGGPDGPRAPRRDQSVDGPMGRPRPADAPRTPTERPPSDGARDDASGADRARGTTVIYRGKSFELIEVRAAGS